MFLPCSQYFIIYVIYSIFIMKPFIAKLCFVSAKGCLQLWQIKSLIDCLIDWPIVKLAKLKTVKDNIRMLNLTCLGRVRASIEQWFPSLRILKKAFDMIPRTHIWHKLLENNINGNCFRIVYKMYQGIKSLIFVNNKKSQLCPCNNGLCQDEHLSPILFCLHLNDNNRKLFT